MHIHKKSSFISKVSNIFIVLLPFLFWGAVIFAFDTPYAAVSTLISAAWHETGHKIAFIIIEKNSSAPLPHTFGFRIEGDTRVSYKDEILCAAAGPFANFILPVIVLPLYFKSAEAYSVLSVISIATGLSNLLPVRSYDGFVILRALAELSKIRDLLINIIEAFSFSFITLMTFFSLYLIGKIGEGYWIFAVFFVSLITELGRSRVFRICHE